jgi:hypothetical protein
MLNSWIQFKEEYEQLIDTMERGMTHSILDSDLEVCGWGNKTMEDFIHFVCKLSRLCIASDNYKCGNDYIIFEFFPNDIYYENFVIMKDYLLDKGSNCELNKSTSSLHFWDFILGEKGNTYFLRFDNIEIKGIVNVDADRYVRLPVIGSLNAPFITICRPDETVICGIVGNITNISI